MLLMVSVEKAGTEGVVAAAAASAELATAGADQEPARAPRGELSPLSMRAQRLLRGGSGGFLRLQRRLSGSKLLESD